jgi:hypothetical protein
MYGMESEWRPWNIQSPFPERIHAILLSYLRRLALWCYSDPSALVSCVLVSDTGSIYLIILEAVGGFGARPGASNRI